MVKEIVIHLCNGILYSYFWFKKERKKKIVECVLQIKRLIELQEM